MAKRLIEYTHDGALLEGYMAWDETQGYGDPSVAVAIIDFAGVAAHPDRAAPTQESDSGSRPPDQIIIRTRESDDGFGPAPERSRAAVRTRSRSRRKPRTTKPSA